MEALSELQHDWRYLKQITKISLRRRDRSRSSGTCKGLEFVGPIPKGEKTTQKKNFRNGHKVSLESGAGD